MWRGIFFVGVVMAAGTLFVLDASLPGGFVEGSGNMRYAQTMAFTTLMLFQLFNVFNARSDEESAFAASSTTAGCGAPLALSLALQVASCIRHFSSGRFRRSVEPGRLAALCGGGELGAVAA